MGGEPGPGSSCDWQGVEPEARRPVSQPCSSPRADGALARRSRWRGCPSPIWCGRSPWGASWIVSCAFGGVRRWRCAQSSCLGWAGAESVNAMAGWRAQAPCADCGLPESAGRARCAPTGGVPTRWCARRSPLPLPYELTSWTRPQSRISPSSARRTLVPSRPCRASAPAARTPIRRGQLSLLHRWGSRSWTSGARPRAAPAVGIGRDSGRSRRCVRGLPAALRPRRRRGCRAGRADATCHGQDSEAGSGEGWPAVAALPVHGSSPSSSSSVGKPAVNTDHRGELFGTALLPTDRVGTSVVLMRGR